MTRVGVARDLVHSVLVFQHLRRNVGAQEFARLVSLLAPGGYGALHFYLGRDVPLFRRVVGTARARYRVVNGLVSTVRRSPTTKALR